MSNPTLLGPVAFDLGSSFWPHAGWAPPPVPTLPTGARTTNKPSAMVEVAAAMTIEMVTNAQSGHAAGIAAMLGSARPDAWWQGLERWRALVQGGAPWDHKRPLRQHFGEWSVDPTNGTEYNYDIWSNVHYGFVGRRAGISEWTLLNGAGFAQLRSGTNPSGYWSRRFRTFGDADFLAAFDDPDDQVAIRLGMRLWAERGYRLTAAQLAAAVRGDAGLKTRPAPSAPAP